MAPSARQIVRIVLTVVCVVISLYLLYLLRKPISWILIAAFLAVALSPPVNVLSRHMRRGFAITITFLGLLAIPLALIALIVPPLITEANDFADNVPGYARDVTKYVKENDRLRDLNEDYDITSKLEEEAGKLPDRLGGAAGTLRDVGFGIVNSLFALVTILVLTAFLLGSGRRWVDALISSRPPAQHERLRRSLDNMSQAVAGYVAGALLIALIAGVATYVVLTILGVPFRGPLALIAGLFSLIPLVGATIAAVVVSLLGFTESVGVGVACVIFYVAYQQFENYVVYPRIMRRAVDVPAPVTVVAVLLGGALLGIVGALIAIPVAAAVMLVVRQVAIPRMDRT